MNKRYKINEMWGLDCYTRGSKFILEVFMLQVPWEEVVDAVETEDKDFANSEFKRLVNKYRNKL